MKTYQEFNETGYAPETSVEIIQLLENARLNRHGLHVFYGFTDRLDLESLMRELEEKVFYLSGWKAPFAT